MIKFVSTKSVPVSGMVSVAAVVCEQPTPQNTLSIIDYTNMYPGNQTTEPQLYNSTNLPICNVEPYEYQLDISDKTIYSTMPDVPTIILGYEYQLKYDHYDAGNPSGSINICYDNGEPIKDVKYTLEFSTSHLYEDFATKPVYNTTLTWGAKPSDTEYRVRLLLPEDILFNNTTICVSYNKVIKRTGAVIDPSRDVSYGWTEIINAKKLYQYTTDYTFNSSTITLAGGGKLAGKTPWVRRSKLANIRVMYPSASDRNGWFLKVWAGAFTNGTNNYHIHEATPNLATSAQASMVELNDTGNPISYHHNDITSNLYRCGCAVYDSCSAPNTFTIVTNEKPLHIWTAGYPNYIPYEAYDAIYNNITYNENTSHGISIFLNGNKMSNSNIKDWDEWNGVIRFKNPIDMGADIRATYVYEQRCYTLQVPDMCPQVHHTGVSNATGEIHIQVIHYGIPLNDSVVIALLPGTVDDENLVWYYRSTNPSELYNDSKVGYSAVMAATSPTVTLVTNTLTLAEVSVKSITPASYTTIYDSRSRGGGLQVDEFYPKLVEKSRDKIQIESDHYSDIGLYDGLGLKKDGVIIIKVPRQSVNDIRDAIVTNSLLEIKNIASGIRDDSGVDEATSILEATEIYRNQYAYQSAVDEVANIARSNVAAGSIVVLVDENMEVL
jgi:hypothetical protein